MTHFLGKHVVVDFEGCPAHLLDDVIWLEETMVRAAQVAQATVVNAIFHHFSPIGVSGVVVIEESHLAIHTWPEHGVASVDIFTCGDAMNPQLAADHLFHTLGAKQVRTTELPRAQVATPSMPYSAAAKRSGRSPKRDIWFTERTADMAFSVRHTGGLLFRQKTAFQQIQVFDTELFGKILVLDGVIALSEWDECIYHEMLVHVPALSHPAPKRALVLGGGDGGAVRQLLLHPEISEVVVVEQDPAIPEIAKRFFPHIAQGLYHPRTRLLFQAANDALAQLATEPPFDLILLDIANPLHPDTPHADPGFLANIQQLLAPNGLCVLPVGSPRLGANQLPEPIAALQVLFGKAHVHYYWANVPTFPFGHCGFALCGQVGTTTVSESERYLQLAASNALRYYSASLHRASFVLPRFVEEAFSKEMNDL